MRLPFSIQLVLDNPPVCGAVVAANPEFAGQPALAVFDGTIAALTAAGLAVILDNHTSAADWCCAEGDTNAVWHTLRYPEPVWIECWRRLARRYRDNPRVIAVDLRNEPRSPARWVSRDPRRSWRDAAERAGAAVLAENPRVLVVVEGSDFASDLRGARSTPVRLPWGERLVYSVHDYPWFHGRSPSARAMRERWDRRWGALADTPVIVGEFGIDTAAWNGKGAGLAERWLRTFIEYLDERGISWIYWPLNGTMSSAAPHHGRQFGAREPFGLLDARWEAPANEALVEWLFGRTPSRC